jgi:hypothetical protein
MNRITMPRVKVDFGRNYETPRFITDNSSGARYTYSVTITTPYAFLSLFAIVLTSMRGTYKYWLRLPGCAGIPCNSHHSQVLPAAVLFNKLSFTFWSPHHRRFDDPTEGNNRCRRWTSVFEPPNPRNESVVLSRV